MDLLTNIKQTSKAALQAGALQPISTTCETVIEQDCHYQLRILNNLKRKDNAEKRLQQAGVTDKNPFLHFDPALYVGDIGHHRCLLNKYNVVDHHLLLVTRLYQSQNDLLNANDFTAAATGLQQIDSLVFYNGGTLAGASQPHKHLQLIPIESMPGQQLPLSAQLNRFSSTITTNKQLPFYQSGIAIPEQLLSDTESAGHWLHQQYLKLLDALKCKTENGQALSAYNLLLTRQWLMIVPRSCEKIDDISLNSLAFCGAFLVRTQAQAEHLKQVGFSKTLRSVTFN